MGVKLSVESGRDRPDRTGVEDPVRRRIVAGARRHFFAQGFRAVTMDDLAGELGMSKKTLYTHFPSKTALLEAVSVDKFRDIERDLGLVTEECSSDFLEALRRMPACIQRHMEEFQPPFLRDAHREAPEVFQRVEARRRNLIQHYFGRLLVEGQRAGIIRKDVPAELIIEILLGATQAIMNPQRLAELDITPKVGFASILTVILEGAVTEEGRSKR
jgi:TetR/AcrR family transcriptional regulator, cholesterol catabolism regulator